MQLKRIIITFSLILFAILIFYRLNPVDYWFMPKCPIKLLTGLNCPGCGFQRALHAVLHGNVTEAISYNFFFVYAIPYFFSFIVVWLMPNCRARAYIKGVIEHKYVLYFYITTFVLWFIIRNIYKI